MLVRSVSELILTKIEEAHEIKHSDIAYCDDEYPQL